MAQFLIDASLPKSTIAIVQSQGYSAIDVRDVGLGSADDSVIAAYARAQQMIILTLDHDFGNILDYPPQDYFGIVIFEPPPDSTGAQIATMVECMLKLKDIVQLLPGRLAIVQPGRIRLRPST